MEKRFQVFVSSTYADLKEERRKVIQTIVEMDCIPAGMELFPAADEEQWKFIQRVIDDCDYYILIIGGRYGTLTSEGISYTEKEYDYAVSKELKVLAFVHERPDEIPLGKSDVDSELQRKLETFREKVKTSRVVKLWNNASELPGLVALSLSKTIKVYPAIGWVRASNVVSGELLADLNELRKENTSLKTTVSQLESQTAPKDTNLASLDDEFTLQLGWSDYVPRKRWRSAGEVNSTWKEMFSCISPDLQTRPSEQSVSTSLGSVLYRRHLNPLDADQVVMVAHEDFQTIRIQFTALGLISTTYTKSTMGGMALFWSLTKKGSN